MTLTTATPEFRLARRACELPARQRAAVAALLEEHTLLTRHDIRSLLIDEDPETAAVACDWERLQRHIHSPAISPSDRAFLQLLLSLACFPTVHLGTTVTELSERRRAIVLRAIVNAVEPAWEE